MQRLAIDPRAKHASPTCVTSGAAASPRWISRRERVLVPARGADEPPLRLPVGMSTCVARWHIGFLPLGRLERGKPRPLRFLLSRQGVARITLIALVLHASVILLPLQLLLLLSSLLVAV